MSEDAIKEKIEVYRMAFEDLHKQAIADIQKLAGTQAQAATVTKDLQNAVHRQLFGHGHDEEGKEIP